MQILTEFETINHLLKNNCSISRFGDGELNHCINGRSSSQPKNKELRFRLCKILKEKIDNHISALPRLGYGRKHHWEKYFKPRFSLMYIQDLYGSAFISRPDVVPEINNKEFFDLVKKLWEGRNIILVHGDEKIYKNSIFSGCNSLIKLPCPMYDGFASFKSILEKLERGDKESLYILSYGPTATVLAYFLAKSGRQALDVGRLLYFMEEYKS